MRLRLVGGGLNTQQPHNSHTRDSERPLCGSIKENTLTSFGHSPSSCRRRRTLSSLTTLATLLTLPWPCSHKTNKRKTHFLLKCLICVNVRITDVFLSRMNLDVSSLQLNMCVCVYIFINKLCVVGWAKDYVKVVLSLWIHHLDTADSDCDC